ncbi:MAG: radical SAM protein [Candidatus Omnitrophota bacterium]
MKKKIILVSLYINNFKIQLALYYLKACLNKYIQNSSEIDIRILTFSHGEDKNLILDKICKEDPDIIGFSCYVWNITKILELSRSIKKSSPKTKIILGGPEVSPRPVQLLKINKSIDFVVSGEGEQRFKQLIEYLLLGNYDIRQIDGMAYRDNGRIIFNKQGQDLSNLNIIPSPYLERLIDIVPKDEYPVETMRGCAFKCNYCYYHKGFKNLRYFSLERIEEEFEFILKKDPGTIYLMDPTFNFDRKRAKEILKIFIRHNKNSRLHVELRAELLDRQMVELLHKARANFIEIGVQSTNKEALKLMNRSFSPSLFRNNILLLNKKRLFYQIQLIASLPQDNYRTFSTSLDFLFRLRPPNFQIERLMMLPGTNLRPLAARFKIRYDRNPPYYAYKSDTYSAKDLKKTMKLEQTVSILINRGLFKESFYGIVKDLDISPTGILESWLKVTEEQGLSFDKIKKIENGSIKIMVILAKLANSWLSLAQYLYKKYDHSIVPGSILSLIKEDREKLFKKHALEIKDI